MSSHIVPVRTYILVFVALECLTVATAALSRIDMGVANTVVALLIAVTKASIVALFFMHLKYSGHVVKLTAIMGIFFLVLLLGLTMNDYFTRSWTSAPSHRSAATAPMP
jgi:cytochrome c oxidase subunit 4